LKRIRLEGFNVRCTDSREQVFYITRLNAGG
jgi:hypothetical protein